MSLMDSGGQHSAVETALCLGARSAAQLQSLALRQGLSIAHLLAGAGWPGVTLFIAGLIRSARHCTFVRVLQVPEAWRGGPNAQPLLPLSFPALSPASQLSPPTPYSL